MLSTWPQGPLISSEEVCILGKGEISPGGGGGGEMHQVTVTKKIYICEV